MIKWEDAPVPRKELIPNIIEYMKKELVTTAPILAREFSISRQTARAILKFLESQGLLISKPLGKDVVYLWVPECVKEGTK